MNKSEEQNDLDETAKSAEKTFGELSMFAERDA